MSEIREARDRLQSHWNTLQEQWQITRDQWRDTVAGEFEREFWDFYAAEMPRLLRTLDELEETLENAFQHTEEP